jgi:hypothetical protein
MAFVTDTDLAATGTGQGANMVGFIQGGSGTVPRTIMKKLRETVSVLDFGASGDGASDDRQAIQDALDWVGANGGGTVFLPPTFAGRYLIKQGIRIPSHVTLSGCAPARYPFNAGNANSSALYGDFDDPMQWIVEPATTSGGNLIPYDTLLSSALPLPDGTTANVGVRDLIVTANLHKAPPYGGIRMHGCPGAMIDNVSVDIASCGVLINCCFDVRINVHVTTPNYGMVVYDVNAGVFDLYAACSDADTKFVDEDYILPHMAALNGAMIPAFHLQTEDHFKRKWGLTVGSNDNTSVGNTLNVRCIERYSGGVFQRLAYSTFFTSLYLEGSVDQTDYGIVSTASHFVVGGIHAYLSGSGQLFDQGTGVTAECFITGIPFTSFGKVYMEASSRLVVRLCNPQQFGPDRPQYNILFPDFGWSEPLRPIGFDGAWHSVGDPFIETTYSVNRGGEVCLAGAATGGLDGTVITTLPPGYRPYKRRAFACFGGVVTVDPNGEVIGNFGSGATIIGLDGVRFSQIS